MGLIYLARNKVNGKCYVGKTKRTLAARRRGHEGSTPGTSLLGCAIRKYGKAAFAWSVLLDDVPDDEQSANRS